MRCLQWCTIERDTPHLRFAFGYVLYCLLFGIPLLADCEIERLNFFACLRLMNVNLFDFFSLHFVDDFWFILHNLCTSLVLPARMPSPRLQSILFNVRFRTSLSGPFGLDSYSSVLPYWTLHNLRSFSWL